MFLVLFTDFEGSGGARLYSSEKRQSIGEIFLVFICIVEFDNPVVVVVKDFRGMDMAKPAGDTFIRNYVYLHIMNDNKKMVKMKGKRRGNERTLE